MPSIPLPSRSALWEQFLGHSPQWYKLLILSFLIGNVLLYFSLNAFGLNGGFVVGWLLLMEFIFALAMALYCYPLQPGGLLAIQAVAMGLTNASNVYDEIAHNLPVLLLLMFMVAGIFFLKELLLETLSRILLRLRNKILLSATVVVVTGVLSAFLDALTVIAVLITAIGGFYTAYSSEDESKRAQLRAYLGNIIMHGAIGTALGGVCTIVGEPQNLLIAKMVGWDFVEFIKQMAPVTVPVAIAGILTCLAVERFKLFGYGKHLSDDIADDIAQALDKQRPTDPKQLSLYQARLWIQAICALLLTIALILHLAEVGLLGLALIIISTSMTGITEEHKLGPAFKEALPFVAMLGCFFAVVAVIHDQHLFTPITQWVLSFPMAQQPTLLFIATGLLSIISDNVFVATVYMGQIQEAMSYSMISREHFNTLAIAINTGTNLPSIATPNGQAAFLFLLTSSLAPRIGLSYLRMVQLAFPYTVVVSTVGVLAVALWL